MFKAGQKVKCVKAGAVQGIVADDLTNGKVYTVVSDSTAGNVNVINDVGRSKGYFPSRFVEVVEQATVAQQPRVGGKVRIVAGHDSFHGFRTGDIVTVTELGLTSTDSLLAEGTVQWRHGEKSEGSQYLRPEHYEVINIDFTKPVFTAEGTPVQIVTTTGRDAKYPVLGYEGKASILSKFTLEGKNKNGTARRHLTNEQPKEEPAETPVATTEVFVNLYEVGTVRDAKGRDLTPGGIIGNQRYTTLEQCNADYGRNRIADKRALVRCGVGKITVVSGRLPRTN